MTIRIVDKNTQETGSSQNHARTPSETVVTPSPGHGEIALKADSKKVVASAGVMKVSDHQPYMLAWLPYYDKVLQSDLHIVMTQAAFSRDDNYVNRFRVSGMKVTVPILRATSGVGAPTWAVRSSLEAPYLITKALKQAYGRKYEFRQRLDPIFDLIGVSNTSIPVAEFNVRVLECVLELLKWDGVLLGDTEPTGVSKVERSVNRLTAAGVEINENWLYLCGEGTVSYLAGEKFPLKVSVQSIANPDAAPSILDVLVKYKDPRKFIKEWCEKNIVWKEPEYL